MITLKKSEEIDNLRQGGAILSRVLGELVRRAAPGVTTLELDELAERLMREGGAEPSFKGYRTSGDVRPFPSSVCISLNDEVVHAPATPSRTLKEGDLLKLDIGLRYKGMCPDMAVTVPIGAVSDDAKRLIAATRRALEIGIEKTVAGNWVSDVGKTVDKFVRRNGFSTVKDLVGHGVGKNVHEEPLVPNFFDSSLEPVRIEPGMTLAIEPMINAGIEDVRLLKDGWTVVTADHRLSAHFEATVAVFADKTEIMTPLPV
ncbi:type I methionyl aminopeptidase [Candidatus Uhrbacteria bacterium]|nr:type I methionyl aminopeptidase [Candidatus Uhrbacteria bacterium]